jgi:thioredoxin 1
MNESENVKDSGSACGGGSCCSGRGKWILIILAVSVVGVLIAKNAGKKPGAGETAAVSIVPAAAQGIGTQSVQEVAAQGPSLPRLIDLGAGKCIPCKMMAPILEDLKKTHVGKMDVQFIDVWENPDAGKKYGINVIPTQIFYDAAGKELFRHEGFFGKEDILTKWKELGVDFTAN